MMPPNIVVVLADDLGIGDLGPYGSRLIRTPAMTRLAADGVVCEAMYAAASTDTPSRAGLLTGRYGARYGLPASTAPGTDAGLPPDAVTVAKLLGSAGYATGLFGQWRLGAGPGRHPLDHGFGRFEGTLYGTDVTPLAWYEGRKAVVDDADSALAARRLTDAALDFVDDHRDGPFLAVLSHLGPHAPYRVEPRFHGASAAGAYGDLVEQLDHYLGVLLRHLDRRRLTRRTLVIVTSDNGPRYEGRNQERRGRKPEVFDGGVRVPFLASWPSVTRRTRDGTPRSLLDLTPSLCALAEVEPPDGLDGEDMSALLSGRPSPGRGPVYLFFNEWLNAVRSDCWKLHVAFGAHRTAYMPQLFDVTADVREAYNLAALNPGVVERLRGPLEQLRDDVAAEAAARKETTTV
ncbi:sulfatase-like hydrolase/transferase [Streptomyces sp. B8F3]|uniref:sulfatase-like hydrolase/transferase n=1 Tax=unclassified Streptomyces TaxID=2593676 RepID=UPI00325CD32F